MPKYLDTWDAPVNYRAFGGSIGNRFSVSETTVITHYMWYKAPGQVESPSFLKLFRLLPSAVSLDALVNVPEGVEGWNFTPLFAGAETLITGEEYVVFYARDSVQQEDVRGWANAPVIVTAPFVHVGGRNAASPSSTPTTIVDSYELVGVGVSTESFEEPDPEPPPGGGGNTPAELAASLAAWLALDPETQLHELDGIPWALKVGQEALQLAVDEGLGMLNALVNLNIALRFGSIDDKLDAIQGVIEQIPIGNTAEHVITRDLVTDALDAAVTDLGTAINAGPVERRAPQDIYPIPGDGWTLLDDWSGTGPALQATPADRYILTITALPAGKTWEQVLGVNLFGYRGWWAPLNVDILGDYKALAHEVHELGVVGAKLPGVFVWLPPDVSWTLEAYQYLPE